MTVIYIDEVFARNAVTDWFLILITARLAGLAPWRKSYFIAALAGGLYAAAAYLPDWAFLTDAPVQCAAGIGLALLAFGQEERLARLTALFFAVSCGFAGCALALRLFLNRLSGPDMVSGNLFHISAVSGENWILMLAAVCTGGTLELGFRAAARLHASGKLIKIRLCVLGRVTECVALADSGNTLLDGGQPVLVISPGVLDGVLPPEARKIFSPEKLQSPPDLAEPVMRICPALRPRLIPYHAVGVSSGLLLTIAGDWMEAGGTRYARPRVALSPTRLGDGYQALWAAARE